MKYVEYIRAASRIDSKIYSSAVLERESEKIKSLQLTLLTPKEANSYKINRQLFERYILNKLQDARQDRERGLLFVSSAG